MIPALDRLLARIRAIFRKPELDAELDEELAHHFQILVDKNLADGLSPDEARRQARLTLGGVEQIRALHREARGLPRLEHWMVDMRFVLRSLNRAPGFTLAMLFTLVLGIGAATIVFNITSGPLFSEGPYPRSSELVALGYKDRRTPFSLNLTGAHFLSYRDLTRVFAACIATEGKISNLVIEGDPAPANHVAISADGFRALGITPALGRDFLAEEFVTGADGVALISDRMWQTRFNAARDVLGREIIIDQRPCKVIGVLRPNQQIPFEFQGDVYRPLVFTLDARKPAGPGLHIVGRLQAGVTPETARGALSTIKLPVTDPVTLSVMSEWQPEVRPLQKVRGQTHWWVLLIAGIFLYAIACINAMNLTLVRLLGRTRELGIRLAVGGTRGQIAPLLWIESAVLALVAGVIVLFIARWWFQPLFVMIYDNPTVRFDLFADRVTVVSVAGLGVIATVAIVALTSVRLWMTNLTDGLKAGSSGDGESRTLVRLRGSLVVVQAALAVVLLAGTGLMMRTFEQLRRVDVGFNPAGRVTVSLDFPKNFERRGRARLQYFERLRQRVATLPGVKHVAYGDNVLLVGGFSAPENFKMRDGSYARVAGSILAADYGPAAGLRLKRGRWFSGRNGDWEVVINETLAHARFGDADPIGQAIQLRGSGDRAYYVVGVVRDVKETLRAPAAPRFYLPDWISPESVRSLVLHLEREPPPEFAGVLRRTIYDFDPMLIVSWVSTLHDVIARQTAMERFVYVLLRGLAMVALALAMIGLFSVMACSVAARRREFGVRLALGALPGNLHRLVLGRGLATVGAGLLLGIGAAVALTRFMETLLFETTPNNPIIFGGVAGLLLISAAAACWIPAHRAATADPLEALRAE